MGVKDNHALSVKYPGPILSKNRQKTMMKFSNQKLIREQLDNFMEDTVSFMVVWTYFVFQH